MKLEAQYAKMHTEKLNIEFSSPLNEAFERYYFLMKLLVLYRATKGFETGYR